MEIGLHENLYISLSSTTRLYLSISLRWTTQARSNQLEIRAALLTDDSKLTNTQVVLLVLTD